MDEQEWMDLAEEAGQLREAMVHRAVIEQAKGVVAVLRGATPEEAFALLRGASMNHNVKLRDLCLALVDAVGPARAGVAEHVHSAVHQSFGAELAACRQIVSKVDAAPEDQADPDGQRVPS